MAELLLMVVGITTETSDDTRLQSYKKLKQHLLNVYITDNELNFSYTTFSTFFIIMFDIVLIIILLIILMKYLTL